MNMRYGLVINMLAICFQIASAQSFVQFKDQSTFFKGQHQTRGFLPSGFTDINGDLIDDLIVFDRGLNLNILSGNPYNKTLHPYTDIHLPHYFDAFSIAIGDLNHDGLGDMVIGGSMGYLRVYLSDTSGFLNRDLPANFLVQTMNITDVNVDGHPDIFVCNDSGSNIFFLNDGQGEFQKKTDIIDFATIPVSDMSGNYGSVWVDINNDLSPDLALAKCRAGVADPLDPRRINGLYVRQENQSYKNEAKIRGFDLGQQSWAVTFGDFDNDGDYDAFVVNHYDPHVLLENMNGTHFVPVSFTEIPLSSFAFQAVSRDFDNDGLLDIVLSGLNGITFLHNRGGLNFEIIEKVPLALRGMSMSVGDINDDGFYDIHAQLNESLNIPGQVDDRLYINEKNNNNYLKIALISNESEPTLTGTKVEIYGPWGKQSRQFIAGESFGITTSSHIHFGTGVRNLVDSLTIYWPSGRLETYRDIPTNNTFSIEPGYCFREKYFFPDSIITVDSVQGVTLQAPEGYIQYQWNGRTSGRDITVYDETQNFVIMKDSLNCSVYSSPVLTTFGCFPLNTDPLGIVEKITFCTNELSFIEAADASKYIWNNGETSQKIFVDKPGVYSVTITDQCNHSLVDSLSIDFIDPVSIVVQGPDSVKQNNASFCVSNSKQTYWFACQDGQWLAAGDTFYFNTKTNDTCFMARSVQEFQRVLQTTGNRQLPGLNQFSSATLNGALVFDVHSPMVLESLEVYTDTPGKRKFIVVNNAGEVVAEKELFISFGLNVVELGFHLSEGKKYSLLTDKEVNRQNLGTDSPRFIRHSGGNIEFPYSIDGVLDITSSNFGTNNYYYFYNWKVGYDSNICLGESIEIPIHVSETSNNNLINNIKKLNLFPNPANLILNLEIPGEISSGILSLYCFDGQKIKSEAIQNNAVSLDIEHLKPGLYTLVLQNQKNTFYSKFIKE